MRARVPKVGNVGEFQHSNYVIVIEFVNTIKLFRTISRILFVKKCKRRPGGKSTHKVIRFITIETNNYRIVAMFAANR